MAEGWWSSLGLKGPRTEINMLGEFLPLLVSFVGVAVFGSAMYLGLTVFLKANAGAVVVWGLYNSLLAFAGLISMMLYFILRFGATKRHHVGLCVAWLVAVCCLLVAGLIGVCGSLASIISDTNQGLLGELMGVCIVAWIAEGYLFWKILQHRQDLLAMEPDSGEGDPKYLGHSTELVQSSSQAVTNLSFVKLNE